MAKTKFKPVLIQDQEALAIVYERAGREHRTCANAAAVTIIESHRQNTANGGRLQGKKNRNFLDEVVDK